jgi:hypothetical protein
MCARRGKDPEVEVILQPGYGDEVGVQESDREKVPAMPDSTVEAI